MRLIPIGQNQPVQNQALKSPPTTRRAHPGAVRPSVVTIKIVGGAVGVDGDGAPTVRRKAVVMLPPHRITKISIRTDRRAVALLLPTVVQDSKPTNPIRVASVAPWKADSVVTTMVSNGSNPMSRVVLKFCSPFRGR